MSTLQTLVSALGTYYDDDSEDEAIYRLIGKFKALAGAIHRRREGEPYLTPDSMQSYAGEIGRAHV